MQQDWKSSWSATHLRCGSDDVIYTHRLISQFLFVSYSITVGSDGGNIYLLGLVFFFPELDNWVNQGHQSKTREETDVHRIIKAAEKNPLQNHWIPPLTQHLHHKVLLHLLIFKCIKGQWVHHFPGKPIPMFNHPSSEENFSCYPTWTSQMMIKPCHQLESEITNYCCTLISDSAHTQLEIEIFWL